MSELTPIVTKAVESWAAKLLEHFKSQYGSLYFIPLGVNSSTPSKIATMVAPTIEQQVLVVQDNQATVNIIDEKVWVVFDTFIDGFYNSLSFLWKTLMKGFELKMTWNEYLQGLNKRKAESPENFKVWKDNLTFILQTVFDEIIIALNSQGKTVYVSNWEQYFNSSKEAIETMKIFQ